MTFLPPGDQCLELECSLGARGATPGLGAVEQQLGEQPRAGKQLLGSRMI